MKRSKRSYERSKVHELEKANTENPTDFWQTIARLGPKKSSKIPWEVEFENGEITCNKEEVLKKWKNDFEGLLTPPTANSVEQEFLKEIKSSNRQRESNFDNAHNMEINQDFALEEVNESLKNDASIRLLTTLFNTCLRGGILPSV